MPNFSTDFLTTYPALVLFAASIWPFNERPIALLVLYPFYTSFAPFTALLSRKFRNINDLNQESVERKDVAAQTSADKLKASNFPASILKIGTWELAFFAKRKLVWEVLDYGLKSQIDFEWLDITALKASGP
eukprot:Gb_07619 [translate_table: standard]